MHDLKFLRIFDINLPDFDASKYKSTTAPESLLVFQANLTRAVHLVHAPGFAGLMSSHLTRCVGTFSKSEVEPEFYKWLQSITREQMDKEIRLHAGLHENTLRASEEAHSAFENLLRTIIVNTSGAFQVLCEDLYDRALIEPSVQPISPQKDPGFASRNAVRTTYRKAFQSASINSHLEKPIVNALALLRNVMVHSMSKADGKFLDGLGDSMPENNPFPFLDAYRSHAKGDEVHVNGDQILEVIESIAVWGFDFAALIDSWLMP